MGIRTPGPCSSFVFLARPGRSVDVANLRQIAIREDAFGKRFRAMDLADLKAKLRPAQGAALKARARSVAASARAKREPKKCAFGLRTVCEGARRKKGAAARG